MDQLRPFTAAPLPPPCARRWSDVDGWQMAARTWVGAQQRLQPPVVCVHGLVVSSRYMTPMAELLARRRGVYAPDLPGFGASAKPAHTLDVDELADTLSRWVVRERLGGAVLVGSSFGCQIVAETARRRPELAGRVVLISPTMDPSADSLVAQLVRWQREQATHSWPLRGIMVGDYAAAGVARAVRTFQAARRHRIEDALPAVSVPALVVRGSADPIVSSAWAREVAGLLPRGQLSTLPGATHAINHEQPLQAARALPRPGRVSRRQNRLPAMARLPRSAADPNLEPAMGETPRDPHPARGDADPRADAGRTVEAEVRKQLAAALGGPRGSLETALPFIVFTTLYLVTDELGPAVVVSVASALGLMAVRLAQRSSTRFAGNGLFAIALAAVIATTTGRAETAFLPGIIQSAAWAVGLVGSVLVRWPVVGFVIGAVLGDTTGWRQTPAIVRLSNRLTLVLAVPMIVRVGVQYPLYLAGEVGWLGVTRVVLGWPLAAAALAAAGAILARGRTPLHRPPRSGSEA